MTLPGGATALLDRLIAAGVEFIVVGGGAAVMLDLPTLIEVKARAGRPKDRLAVPVLIATLEERLRRQK